ncbi:MAG: dephospho-CoA kinase [Clostridia bacterium]|nr:dephospho-CoA kinase [Clostridia bacterium]
MKQSNILVAITGGIGSGKSSALKILKDNGFATFSCDEEVSALYKKRGVLRTLKKEFPAAIKGKFSLSADRKEIAKVCFADDKKRLFLESVLSAPALKNAVKKAKKIKGVAFIEVPILFECKAEGLFDKVFVIKRDKGKRIEGVKLRAAISEEEIAARMNKQIDYDSFDFTGATIIENEGTESDLKTAVLKAANEIK